MLPVGLFRNNAHRTTINKCILWTPTVPLILLQTLVRAIILLSLVRSNAHGKLGFTSVDNRVCVALSRARLGFFCACNLTMLSSGSERLNVAAALLRSAFFEKCSKTRVWDTFFDVRLTSSVWQKSRITPNSKNALKLEWDAFFLARGS